MDAPLDPRGRAPGGSAAPARCGYDEESIAALRTAGVFA